MFSCASLTMITTEEEIVLVTNRIKILFACLLANLKFAMIEKLVERETG